MQHNHLVKFLTASKYIDNIFIVTVTELPGYSYTPTEEDIHEQKSWKDDKDTLTSSLKEALLVKDRRDDIRELEGVATKSTSGMKQG